MAQERQHPRVTDGPSFSPNRPARAQQGPGGGARASYRPGRGLRSDPTSGSRPVSRSHPTVQYEPRAVWSRAILTSTGPGWSRPKSATPLETPPEGAVRRRPRR